MENSMEAPQEIKNKTGNNPEIPIILPKDFLLPELAKVDFCCL